MNHAEPNWLLVNKTYRACPSCKKGELDTRVRRGALVKNFLFFLDLKRYQCSHCGHKAYISSR